MPVMKGRVVEFTVLSQPVPKARPRLGRNGHIFTPRKTEKAEWEIRQAWEGATDQEPFSGAVSLHCQVLLPQPASIPKYRRQSAMPTVRPDLDNYGKTLLDGLRGVAFRDDAQVVELWIAKMYAVDRSPRWEVRVSELLEQPAARGRAAAG